MNTLHRTFPTSIIKKKYRFVPEKRSRGAQTHTYTQTRRYTRKSINFVRNINVNKYKTLLLLLYCDPLWYDRARATARRLLYCGGNSFRDPKTAACPNNTIQYCIGREPLPLTGLQRRLQCSYTHILTRVPIMYYTYRSVYTPIHCTYPYSERRQRNNII